MRYRDLPRFVLRRINRMAGEVKSFLVVVAIGLAMLDLAYLAQNVVYALSPAVPPGHADAVTCCHQSQRRPCRKGMHG